MSAAFAAIASLVCSQLAPARASGQLPLITEDPSSPCASQLGAALGYSMDLVGPGHDLPGEQEFRTHLDMAAPLVQLNYGITDRIQGRVEGALMTTTVAPNSGGRAVGVGDVSTGIKYRFMDQIDGLEFDDTCDPRQSEDRYGLEGPVSISIFPQFIFPTGSATRGTGAGEYSLDLPADVARKFGKLYLVGEAEFIWSYHRRTGANHAALGLAAYYSITDSIDLLGEQRVEFATSGRGPALWLMNLGAMDQLNEHEAVFGAVGTSAAATSTIAPSWLMLIVGIEFTFPTGW